MLLGATLGYAALSALAMGAPRHLQRSGCPGTTEGVQTVNHCIEKGRLAGAAQHGRVQKTAPAKMPSAMVKGTGPLPSTVSPHPGRGVTPIAQGVVPATEASERAGHAREESSTELGPPATAHLPLPL